MEINLPIDLLNIYHNNNEECMICKDALSSGACYTLPECKHTYHTSCLISWFRNGDNRCPYCGNKGINNICNNHNNNSSIKNTSYYYLSQSDFADQYINDLKKFMNSKKNTNNPHAIKLIKKFEKIKTLEENLKQNKYRFSLYKEKIKTQPVIYSESRKNLIEFRQINYKLEKNIHHEKFKIINNSYIIPLIIPSSVNIH
tara:strand:+ start:4963 stop:5562 length:600 start_codon:yes stop_codon:yes gene_type:complete